MIVGDDEKQNEHNSKSLKTIGVFRFNNIPVVYVAIIGLLLTLITNSYSILWFFFLTKIKDCDIFLESALVDAWLKEGMQKENWRDDRKNDRL